MAGFFIGKCGAFDFYKIRTSNYNEMIKIGEGAHIEAEILPLIFCIYIQINLIPAHLNFILL